LALRLSRAEALGFIQLCQPLPAGLWSSCSGDALIRSQLLRGRCQAQLLFTHEALNLRKELSIV
jgi:hypothetical protein